MDNNIYINGRFLCNKIDGISRFSLELCKQLKQFGVNFTIVIPKWLDFENKERFKIVSYGNLKSHLWEQLDLRIFLKMKGDPLLINFSGLGPLFYSNQIITIHDLSFYENKKWFSRSYTFFYSVATPILAKNALKILTVSEFSRREILKYLKIDNEKIEVIYNAVTDNFKSVDSYTSSSESIKKVIGHKYLLAVSSIDPRKNLQNLIDSFVELKLQDYKLVLVGKSSSHFNIKLKVDSESIIFTGFITDNDLSVLYRNCDFFVYPSLYEGFGIPPLEAMSCGCAVLTSAIPSIVEICGDAALYINPLNKESIKEGILKMISDDTLKKEFQARGIIRAEKYNWNDSGSKLYQLIKKNFGINEDTSIS